MTRRSSFSRAITGFTASVHAWWNALRYIVSTPRRGEHRAYAGTRRLLIVCRTFPPALDGGVYRLVAIASEASRSGWQVDIIAGPVTNNPPSAGVELAERLSPTVRVHRWRRPAGQPILRVAPMIDGGFLEIEQIVRKSRNLTPDVILASGPTFSEFVAARLIGAAASVPYALDYRDEWTENPAPFVERGLTDRYWERFALADASAVICTTPGAARHLPGIFGAAIADKLHVVPNGWDSLPLTGVSLPRVPDEPGRCIVFFGTLKEHVDFDSFAADLEQLLTDRPDLETKVRIGFVGEKASRYRHRMASGVLSRVCIDVDHQPEPVVAANMSRCLGLLLLNSEAARRAIPGKTYAYIAARRPILIYGGGGDVADLFRGVAGARLVERGQPEDLGRAIDALISGALDRELADRSEALVESTSRVSRSEKLLGILMAIAQGNDR